MTAQVIEYESETAAATADAAAWRAWLAYATLAYSVAAVAYIAAVEVQRHLPVARQFAGSPRDWLGVARMLTNVACVVTLAILYGVVPWSKQRRCGNAWRVVITCLVVAIVLARAGRNVAGAFGVLSGGFDRWNLLVASVLLVNTIPPVFWPLVLVAVEWLRLPRARTRRALIDFAIGAAAVAGFVAAVRSSLYLVMELVRSRELVGFGFHAEIVAGLLAIGGWCALRLGARPTPWIVTSAVVLIARSVWLFVSDDAHQIIYFLGRSGAAPAMTELIKVVALPVWMYTTVLASAALLLVRPHHPAEIDLRVIGSNA